MFVLSIEHVTPALGGYLTRHMQLIKHGIYVGNINARIRAKIIKKIEEENSLHSEISAIGVFNSNNEIGFSYVTIGESAKIISDFDGLQILSTIDTRSEKERFAFSLWAKLDLSKNLYKSLYHHMYETGALSKVLLTSTVYVPLIKEFKTCIKEKLSDEEVINLISFLVACHDIGKAAPSFQLKANDDSDYKVDFVKEYIKKKGLSCDFTQTEGFRHEIVSGSIIHDYLKEKCCDKTTARCIKNVYENHHLTLESDSSINKIHKEASPEVWNDVHHILLNKLYDDFKPWIPFTIDESKKEVFDTLLLSFIYRCDWMSSSLFSENEPTTIPYKEYVDNKIDDYLDYLDISKIDYSATKEVSKISDIFPYIIEPHPLQKIAEKIRNTNSGFECVLIEDETGAGKTESGFYLAYKAMLNSGKQGIYFGLPTGTTEETMNPRIQNALNMLFKENIPSVRYATGKSWMIDDTTKENARFAYTTHRAQKAMCPYATGTVDQIEIGVLKNRFSIIQLMDFTTKVVVIDEMHAYDAYMRGVLTTALTWLKAYHVPVVIMSATLPKLIKEEIYKVYSCDTNSIVNSYPLITVLEHEKATYYPVESKENKKLYFNVLPFYEDNQKIIAHALVQIEKGGNIAIIVNSVKKALELYDEAISLTNIPVYLFHGRNTIKNKEENTEFLLSKYSKEAKEKGNRPKKSIVISTQILEQSIDVDFDYMISELAPIDLLIQRAGRERRHDDVGTIREKNRTNKTLEVLTSSINDLSVHTVYSKADHEELLARTLEFIQKNKFIEIPSQLRDAVDYVYDSKSNRDLLKSIKADVNTIDLPDDKYLPFEKEKLNSEISTRLSDFETIEIAIVPNEILEKVRTSLSKDLALKIKQEYCISIPSYLINEGDIVFEGEKWLKDTKFLSSEKFEIDKIKGFLQKKC